MTDAKVRISGSKVWFDQKEVTKEDIDRFGDGFETLRHIRYVKGAEEYGDLTFLDNDIIRMMAEELADTANYCKMQFIKLMLLKRELDKQYPSDQDFNGTKRGWE